MVVPTAGQLQLALYFDEIYIDSGGYHCNQLEN